MDKDNKKILLKRVLKSLLVTIFTLFISTWGVFAIFMKVFKDHSENAQTAYMIMSFFIVTIFVIVFCCFTILEKLDRK